MAPNNDEMLVIDCRYHPDSGNHVCLVKPESPLIKSVNESLAILQNTINPKLLEPFKDLIREIDR